MTNNQSALSRNELRQEFLRILQVVVKEDISGVSFDDDLPIQEQVAIDSMDFLDFAIEVKKSLRIDLPDETIAEFSSIRHWLDFACREVQIREVCNRGVENPA